MNTGQQLVPHQLYRARDKEVVLHAEGEVEHDEQSRSSKILTWIVREVTLNERRDAYLFGDPFEVPAGELAPLHRVIRAPA